MIFINFSINIISFKLYIFLFMAIIFYQDFIAMIFSINHQIVYYLKLYMLLSRILIAFYYLMYPLQASFFDW